MYRFNYTVKISATYQWILEVAPEGLFYHDVSGLYNHGPDRVTKQEISDFWKYGPVLPIPDPALRTRLLDIIRDEFRPDNGTLQEPPFPILAYPRYDNPPQWVDGDFRVSDFVILRDYGIEYGRENFHDGLVWNGFVSFEHCLTRPEFAQKQLGYPVWEDIISRLPDRGNIEFPGQPVIPAHPVVEKTELKRRIEALDDPAQPEAKNDLADWAGNASDLNRFDAAQALWEKNQPEESVRLLLSLLAMDDPEHYWRNVVFNVLFKRYNSRTAREWVVQCLHGERDDYFKKAADVLRMWGLFENAKLNAPALLAALNWIDKERGTAEFRAAAGKVKNILDNG